MQIEIEAKFTNIDKDDIRQKLKQAGAVLLQPERLMRRKAFDYPDLRLHKNDTWLRVRDEGDKITSSFKQQTGNDLHGIKEINIVVDDFDNTANIYESLGMIVKSSQETKRESWTIGDTQIEIDTWPWIPSFLEIEGKDEASVREVAHMLGLDWNYAKFGPAVLAFQEVFDMTQDEVNLLKEIVFGSTPEHIEKRRKS